MLLDGGLATTVEAAGRALDPTLWSAGLLRDDPEALRAAHTAFLEAGADVIATGSYQASFEGFAAVGVGEAEVEALLELSVRLAVEARDTFWAVEANRVGRLRPLVAASIGPYGAFLADGSEYDGRYGVGAEALEVFHRRRFQLLADSPADLIACETFPSAAEVEVMLSILRDTPGVWTWISVSCRDGAHLNDGTSVTELARMCDGAERLSAIAVNCTAPEHVAAVVEAMRGETSLPVLAYPNSGEGWDAVGRRWTDVVGGVDFLDSIDRCLAAGAEGIGGCCRIGPDVVRELRRRLADSRNTT